MSESREPRVPSEQDDALQRPDTGTAGAPDTKGRAKSDRADMNEVLEQGMPPEYRRGDPET
jgi:hypothetical protein